ncbi:4-hydroxyphenylacetate 3-monooxygenase, partial [Virgibacillus halodenitrificans]|nr:4-hydroxyphenylacetate 3-monooxygenase [Virgibacillus halodenitrificans]
ACNIFPKAYARFTDIIQQLGASGLISIPPEAAFDSDIRKDLDHYLQSKADDALSRVKLFRLAWEISMSAFGTREIQYERFFFGDPVKLASGLYQSYDRSLFVERISSFLEKE